MKCPHCGKEIGDGSQFCVFCMKSLVAKTDTTPNFKKNKTTYIMIALAVYIVIMLAIAAYLLLFKSCKSSSAKPTSGSRISSAMSSSGEISSLGSSAIASPENGATENPKADNDSSSSDSLQENSSSASSQNKKSLDGSAVTTSRETSTTSSEKTSTESQTSPEAAVSSSKETAASSSKKQTSSKSASSTSSNVSSQKTSSPATACSHDWVAITKTVHHKEQGHYETEEKAKKVTKYKCAVCYELFSSLDAYYSHFEGHIETSGSSVSFFKDRYELADDWEYYDEKVWVVDKEASDEKIITGYKCSKCGEKK